MAGGRPTLETLPAPPAGKTGWPWTVAGSPAADQQGTTHPRITVVTPSYNQAEYLEATLRSVLLQGYPDLEYIVLDGGSTDGSVEVLRRYAPWLTRWRSEPDGGQTAAINEGFAEASGEILHWLNSDDILLPGALAHAASLARQHPEAAAWVGACHRIDPDGRILSTIPPRGLDRDSVADWAANFFYQPSCFIAASAWAGAGPMDESLEYVFDFDLWLRLAEAGPLVGSDEVLSAATIHADAKSQRRGPLFEELYRVQRSHGYAEVAEATRSRREAGPARPPWPQRIKRLAWRWARRLGISTGTNITEWVAENRLS